MKRLIAVSVFIVAMSVPSFGSAIAAGNPAGTGQPGTPTVSCGAVTAAGDSTMQPNGLTTTAFLNIAAQQYAGSPLNPNSSGNTHAVSQYDIACYQFTTNHS